MAASSEASRPVLLDDWIAGAESGEDRLPRSAPGQKAGEADDARAKAAAPEGFSTAGLYVPDLAKFCKRRFGNGATVTARGMHLFNLSCRLPSGKLRPVDAEKACDQQFGKASAAMAVGLDLAGWRCVKWPQTDRHVVPFLIVPMDLALDPAVVEQALANVARVIRTTQAWYLEQMGDVTFKALQPLIHVSRKSAEDWRRLSCRTAGLPRPAFCPPDLGPEERYVLLYEAINEVSPRFQRVQADIAVPLFTFSGLADHDFFLGAAALGGPRGVSYNVQAPNVAACPAAEPYCGTYAFGHETGHNFGLPHTCDRGISDCQRSIMWTASPPTAILFDVEKDDLRRSSFFQP
ncbi:MAG TPA: M12 family metallo-peptidase [Thermoanaerobaculia bacterium]